MTPANDPHVMYDKPASMEPMMPSLPGSLRALREQASRLVTDSAELNGMLAPATREALGDVVALMNCYYSNLIEGHRTYPHEIEDAVTRGRSSTETRNRDLVELGLAHLAVQKRLPDLVGGRVAYDRIVTPTFIQSLHREFYAKLPESMQWAETKSGEKVRVDPGAWRTREVTVGEHQPPYSGSVEDFVTWLCKAYSFEKLDPLDRVIGAAAAHHRLAWVHPFPDGNGRVARLFTDAMLQAELRGGGIWRVSRGFARDSKRYTASLAEADQQRASDLDGRGNLSEKALVSWCSYFLETAHEQVRFMTKCLDPQGARDRIMKYASYLGVNGQLHPAAAPLLAEAFARGEVPRSELPGLMQVSERSARTIANQLHEMGLVDAAPGAHVRVRLPTSVVPWIFPQLYPADVDATLIAMPIARHPAPRGAQPSASIEPHR